MRVSFSKAWCFSSTFGLSQRDSPQPELMGLLDTSDGAEIFGSLGVQLLSQEFAASGFSC